MGNSSNQAARLRAQPEHAPFDPKPYRDVLVAIMREIEDLEEASRSALDEILRRHPRDGRGFFSKAEIIAGFRAFASEEGFRSSEPEFLQRMQRRPVRSQSGVTPITVLTKPFPCPGECVYCPNDVRMPKSYLADEPGAQRAANNRFDPYLQTWNRLAALHAIGHSTDKVELIVLGGTWSFYSEPYQCWFIERCFDAMNDFGAGRDGRDAAFGDSTSFDGLGDRAPRGSISGPEYNRFVRDFMRGRANAGGACAAPEGRESARWQDLDRAQRRNEDAVCRCVGLSLETRPDYVTPEETRRLRRLGCTKVQIGIQSLSDAVLDAIKRGHGVEHTRRAIRLLRRAGFKIHAHWMPNLPESDPARDLADYDRMFDDVDFRPDELKIYPCSLIESAELMEFHADGRWKPYEHAELLEVLAGVLVRTPRYCRLTRVIRDISSDDIVVGNKLTNFREIAEREVARRSETCVEIRSREIRGETFDSASLTLRANEYDTSVGREIFLEFVTREDAIVAFLRLSLPGESGRTIEVSDEIASSAMIREVHVYGAALDIGARPGERAQHRGLGTRLIEEAAQRARQAGFERLSVISAVGTRGYYRKLGFEDGAHYQHLDT